MGSLRLYEALYLRPSTATHRTFRQGIGEELQTGPARPAPSAHSHVEWDLVTSVLPPIGLPLAIPGSSRSVTPWNLTE
jgi:hypothetical protein